MRTPTVILSSIVLLLNQPVFTQKEQPTTQPKPLILEQNEGERRVRRPRDIPMASSAFTIKVDRTNGGSNHLVMGIEEMPPGSVIPKHKHLGQDEILLIQSGSAHVSLGPQERDAHAGAVVFIPSETWIGLKNIGSEDIKLVFIFSAPGFEEYLRCTSVPGDKPATPITMQEFQQCQHQGHAIFEAAAGPADRHKPQK